MGVPRGKRRKKARVAPQEHESHGKTHHGESRAPRDRSGALPKSVIFFSSAAEIVRTRGRACGIYRIFGPLLPSWLFVVVVPAS